METVVKPYPFDLGGFSKGDWIPTELCERAIGCKREDRRYDVRLLSLRWALERQWERERGEEITTATFEGGIRICTDDDAVKLNERRSNNRIAGIRRDVGKLNGVDVAQLSTEQVKDHHARALTRLGAFLAGGYKAARAALRGHTRSTPGLSEKGTEGQGGNGKG